MKRLAAIIFGLFMAVIWAQIARSAEVSGIDIIEVGIFKVEVVETESLPGTVAGRINIVKTESLIKQTNWIPAERGISFGFRYALTGSQIGVKVTVTMITKTPGLKAPGKRGVTFEGRRVLSRVIGREYYWGYSFEEDWEMVPGAWAFQIFYKDKMLSEITFNVYL
ncbi:MAG: DUF3859 domain-containing protein [bacterium]